MLVAVTDRIRVRDRVRVVVMVTGSLVRVTVICDAVPLSKEVDRFRT